MKSLKAKQQCNNLEHTSGQIASAPQRTALPCFFSDKKTNKNDQVKQIPRGHNAYCFFTKNRATDAQKAHIGRSQIEHPTELKNSLHDLLTEHVYLPNASKKKTGPINNIAWQAFDLPLTSQSTIITIDIFSENNGFLTAPSSGQTLYTMMAFCSKKFAKCCQVLNNKATRLPQTD